MEKGKKKIRRVSIKIDRTILNEMVPSRCSFAVFPFCLLYGLSLLGAASGFLFVVNNLNNSKWVPFDIGPSDLL